MKAAHKNARNDTYESKPLSVEQLNAIPLLCTGATDAEVASTVGVQRETIWRWRHEHPDFMGQLEMARQQFMSGSVDKLRAALPKAVGNIVNAIEGGDLKASLALLKCVGLEGSDHFKPGETDASRIALTVLLKKLSAEGVPEKRDFLIGVDRNPDFDRRKAEILEELGRGEIA
jgi:Helix-turn-helix of insertion element transposase